MMPPQLRKAKRRSRHSEPRPVVELLPHVDIHELRHILPRHENEIVEPNVELKYPLVARLRLSATCIEITDRISAFRKIAACAIM